MNPQYNVTAIDNSGYTLLFEEFDSIGEAKKRFDEVLIGKRENGFFKVRIEKDTGDTEPEVIQER